MPVSPEARGIWDRSDAYLDRMRQMVRQGFEELEEARKSQNIGRVNCVNENLTTVKGLWRLTQGNWASLDACVRGGDVTCAEHEFIKISIAFQKGEEAEGALRGCSGPAIDYVDYREIRCCYCPPRPEPEPSVELSEWLFKREENFGQLLGEPGGATLVVPHR